MVFLGNWGNEEEDILHSEEEDKHSGLKDGLRMMGGREKLDPFWKFLTSRMNPLGMAARFAISPQQEVKERVTSQIPVAGHFLTEAGTEEIMALSPEDRNKVFAWEAAELGLYVLGPLVGKAVGGGLGFGAKQVLKAAKATGAGRRIAKKIAPIPLHKVAPKVGPAVLPTARIQSLEGFSYGKALARKLKKNYKVRDDEAVAIGEALQNKDMEILRATVAERLVDKQLPSQGFDKLVVFKEGLPKFREGIEEALSSTTMRSDFYRGKIRKELKRLMYRGDPAKLDVVKLYPEAAFQKQAIKFLGYDKGSKLKLGEASAEQMSAFLDDMVRHPDDVLRLQAPHGQKWFTATSPIRTVMGYGNPFYKTFDKVYKPGSKAMYGTRQQKAYEVLTFNNMLAEQPGFFRKPITLDRFGVPVVKPTSTYTPKTMEKAGLIIQKLDDVSQGIRKGADFEGAEDLKRQMTKFATTVTDGDPLVGKFIKTWQRFSDHLYGDMIKQKIPLLFERSGLGLTAQGRRTIESFVDDAITPIVDRVFYRSHLPTIAPPIKHAKKVQYIEKLLEGTKTKLDQMAKHGAMFNRTGKKLEEGLVTLREDLSLLASPRNNHRGFPGYLENYAARQSGVEDRLHSKWSSTLIGKPGYEAPRTRILGEKRTFPEMLNARIGSQMNDLYLHDTLNEIVNYSKGLPLAWRQTVEHWISNSMGRPSATDVWWAGKVRKIPGTKAKSVQEVMQSSRTIVTAQYNAGLGFKTQTPKRNMFQSLVTVPAEQGGPLGIYDWAVAVAELFSPKRRALLREIGVIAEFAEDITVKSSLRPWREGVKRTIGKAKGGGPRAEVYTVGQSDIQDLGLWMFKSSEYSQRYIAGSAGLDKWNRSLKFLDRADDFKKFLRRSGVFGSDAHKRDEIHDLLRLAKVEGLYSPKGQALITGARNLKVLDVAGATQFLYGPIEAPQLYSSLGTAGKNVLLYQSWWMNYGDELAKWFLRTGDAKTKSWRLFNWMVSSAVAAEAMGLMWDTGKVVGNVFLGPFENILGKYGVPTPQLLQAPIQMLKQVVAAAELIVTGPRELSKKGRQRVAALLNAPVSALGREGLGFLNAIRKGIQETIIPGGQQALIIEKKIKKRDFPALKEEILGLHGKHEDEWRPITPLGIAAKKGTRLALGFLRGGR